MFDDISESIIQKIDLNLEIETNSNEYTHAKSFNGYNFERNCISKFMKLVGDNIKLLPNLYFFIDEKKSYDIAKKLGLKLTQKTKEANEIKVEDAKKIKIHYGFSESDLFIECMNTIDFKVLKDFIPITTYPITSKFEPNQRYIFEIKSNSKEVNKTIIEGLNRKGKELQEALIKQYYFKNVKNICPVIILD